MTTSAQERLNVLAVEISELHKAAEAARQTSLERARQAGEKLIEVKGLLRHGEWLPWLQSIGLPDRTARDYMHVARLSPAKLATVADLGLRAALETLRSAPARPDPAAQRGQPNRDGPDFWPTPVCLIAALVRHVLPSLPPAPIWECAAGDGRLAEAISAAGRRVTATDLHPQDGSAPLDFLTDDPPLAARGSIAVTNPPFNRSEAFIDRALSLIDARVLQGAVLLLRHDHLMAGGRVEALNRAVREIHCNWRPLWIEDTEGNPRWSFHWLVWQRRGQRLPPLYLDEAKVLSAVKEAAE